MNRVDKGRMQAAFSRRAGSYDARAVAQGGARERVASLVEAHAGDARALLDVGAGTGALAARLAQGHPERRLTLVDLATGMCSAARAAVPGAEVVRADAERLPFCDGRFDAVVSSSAMQWLARLEPALSEARRVAAPGGAIVIALFAERTLRELRESWLAVGGASAAARMHGFFRRDEIERAVAASGLTPIAFDEEEIVERHADARAVLRAIRDVGAGNAVPRPETGGLGGRRVTLALGRSICSSRGRIWSSMSWRSATGSAPVAAEKTRTGCAEMSYWAITGGWAPSGSCPCATPTLSRAFWTASPSGTESLNSTKTRETSSRDQEKTLLTPAIELTASSSGRVTDSSMSSGAAPG